MKIKMVIGEDSLGDNNNTEDNQRYADAVNAEIVGAYPEADIEVIIGEHFSCHVSDDDNADEIRDEVRAIANNVWNSASY